MKGEEPRRMNCLSMNQKFCRSCSGEDTSKGDVLHSEEIPSFIDLKTFGVKDVDPLPLILSWD